MKIADFLRQGTSSRSDYFRSLFAAFPPGGSVTVVHVPAGKAVLRQDEPCQSVFVLLEGCARASIHQHNSTHALSDVMDVEFFGEYEVLAGDEIFLADVIAQTDCQFLAISTKDYLRWMRSDSDLLLTRTRRIVTALLQQAARERSSIYLASDDRMIRFLLDYYEQYATDGRDTVTVALTRADIGERTGFSMRTINRAVCSLFDRGLIARRKGKIVLTPTHCRRLRQVQEASLS